MLHLLFLLVAVLPATPAAQSTTSNGTCTTFTWDTSPPYLKASYPPIRITGASTCPGSNTTSTTSNRTCTLTARGDAPVSATSNITNLYTSQFAPVVNSTVPADTLLAPSFRSFIAGAVDTRRILEGGESGYLNFTAYLFCYTGSVGGCSSGSSGGEGRENAEIQNGAGVEICAPVFSVHRDGYPVLEGGVEVVGVGEEDVDRYPDVGLGFTRDPYLDGAGLLRVGWAMLVLLSVGTMVIGTIV
ncbi:hypothetical protein BJY04DRAFT_212839 [Aspergillus karnatakaensis]|uniref:uncharacterized protein n=1 Tax=Aspergillus karnatakaensis TaxID=1810916 RepID=UPI003CCCCB50